MKKYFAPGRVNLIGEHLDYNGGLVLPAAISLGVTATFTPRNDNKIILDKLVVAAAAKHSARGVYMLALARIELRLVVVLVNHFNQLVLVEQVELLGRKDRLFS